MFKSIEYKSDNSFIRITTVRSDTEGLEFVEDFFFKILFFVLVDEPVKLITIEPKKYSFGQGVETNYILRIGKDKVLVNEISKCTSGLLKSISNEEEFRRGLLFLVKSNKDISENEIAMILEIVNRKQGDLPAYLKLICCEDDGRSLCLYNVHLKDEFLQSL